MKNTKKFVALLLTAIMLLTCTACGSKPQASTPAGNTAQEPSYPTAENPVTMRIGHGNGASDEDIVNNYAKDFARLVEEYTEGAVKCEVYPSSQLGDEAEMYGACGLGTLEACVGAATNYVQYAPTLNFLTLPYIFESVAQARDFFKDCSDWMIDISVKQANSRIITISCPAARDLTARKPITCLDDMKGLKVRTPNTMTMINCYEAWGASPQVVSWGETYTALEQGVVEAQDNPIWVLIDNKFAEVQDYYIATSYIMQPQAFVVSENFYQSLSPEQQAGVDRAAAEATVNYEAISDEAWAKYKVKAEAEGVTFLDAPADIDQWIELARGTWDAVYDLIGNGDADYAAEVLAYINDYNTEWSKTHN